MGEMIDRIWEATMKYIDSVPKSKRKKYGQFFTSKETAAFMAGLFSIPEGRTSLNILDPGAGSGILSVALLERLESNAEIDTIELVCYENDSDILGLLRSNLEWACSLTTKNVSFRIVTDNYILSQTLEYNHMLGANQDTDKFDMVIGNPPYIKIAKDAPEATAMPDVCYGAPNLYFLFATMSMFNLKENGEMVYIIPRSWTSGAYFKQFRKNFFKECVLEHIHLFVSRNRVFEKESVLQETIIIKAKKILKDQKRPESIIITTSQGNADFSNRTIFEAPYSTVINGKDLYIYLATNTEEIQVLDRLNRWTDALQDIGLKMRTGVTVPFRNRKALCDSVKDNAVPLFCLQHIHDGKIMFPVGKEHEYIVTTRKGLLQKNTNYLFVKRLATKEADRCLQCGVYLARNYPEYAEISTQNNINFICGDQELSECIVYGLYVLFNSTLYDRYYRILNGTTQVSSIEVNSMPVPPISIIESMGKELICLNNMSTQACDKILENYI